MPELPDLQVFSINLQKKLHIKSVLKDAQKQILKKDPDIISGEVRDFLPIHNSKKTHSPTGGEIISTTVNARVTYYTEEQELFE